MTRPGPGRPRGSKNKPKEGSAGPADAPAAAAPAAAALGSPSGAQASKKRAAGAVASPPQPGAGEPAHPAISELEKSRLKLAEELAKVEGRIYQLETTYLETSSPFGNAIRGYEGFLGGAAAASRKVVVKPEDRLFSWSSVTGQMQR